MTRNPETPNLSQDPLKFFREQLNDLRAAIEKFRDEIPNKLTNKIKQAINEFGQRIENVNIPEQKEEFDKFVKSLEDIFSNPEYIKYKEVIDRLTYKVEELRKKVAEYIQTQLNQLSDQIPTNPEKIKELADKGRYEAENTVQDLVEKAIQDPKFKLPLWPEISKHLV